MRMLLANDVGAGAGGVESYLAALVPALRSDGHEVALLHDGVMDPGAPVHIAGDDVPHISVREGLPAALERVTGFAPDVCFSHNMQALEVDEALAARWPLVKMLHGHFGTCVSARKAFGLSRVRACGREFGPACLLHYLPHRCGAASPLVMMDEYAWARRQRALFTRYGAIVVASTFMRETYLRAGVDRDRVTAIPLFAPLETPASTSGYSARDVDVLFLGRLTALKGPGVLLQAIARHAPGAHVVMAGDGPERGRLQEFAESRGLHVRFTGWVTGAERERLLFGARLLAVPSIWPEPFGLVGLEAGAFATPAVAFDSGGIREWLRDGVNGRLVSANSGADGLGHGIAATLADRDAWSRLSAGARAASAEFSIARHVQALGAVISRVLSPGP